MGLCFQATFFVKFQDRFFIDIGFISIPFFGIFRNLSASLFLVIVGNHSIRKRVSCKSKGIKFSTFLTCFVDFVSSSRFIKFLIFLKPFEAPFDTIFEKKPFRKSLQKKGTPHLKTTDYGRIQGLPETPPLIILYKGRRLAGALSRQ